MAYRSSKVSAEFTLPHSSLTRCSRGWERIPSERSPIRKVTSPSTNLTRTACDTRAGKSVRAFHCTRISQRSARRIGSVLENPDAGTRLIKNQMSSPSAAAPRGQKQTRRAKKQLQLIIHRWRTIELKSKQDVRGSQHRRCVMRIVLKDGC